MQNKYENLTPDSSCHIYNRANGNEQMFKSNENYRYFLEKYIEYIHPIADTFCYCLMPNHFHFLIRVKSKKELQTFFDEQLKDYRGFKSLLEPLPKFETLEGVAAEIKPRKPIESLISKQFSNFFSGYTQAFNKQHGRMGSLFMKNFKRKKIDTSTYLIQLIKYIHHNPLEAKLSSHLEDWPYSSYLQIISSTAPSFLKREELLNWVDGADNFKYIHTQQISEPLLDD
jgi:putative transposase